MSGLVMIHSPASHDTIYGHAVPPPVGPCGWLLILKAGVLSCTPAFFCFCYYYGMVARKNDKVKKVMGEYAEGTLHSGSKKGPVVKKKAQAIAIALSEQSQKDSKTKKK